MPISPEDRSLIIAAAELADFYERRNAPGCFYGDSDIAAALRRQARELLQDATKEIKNAD